MISCFANEADCALPKPNQNTDICTHHTRAPTQVHTQMHVRTHLWCLSCAKNRYGEVRIGVHSFNYRTRAAELKPIGPAT